MATMHHVKLGCRRFHPYNGVGFKKEGEKMLELIFFVIAKMFYTVRLLAGMNIVAHFMLEKRKYFLCGMGANAVVLVLGGAFAFWSDKILHLPFQMVQVIYGSHYVGISLLILLIVFISYRGNGNAFLFVYMLGYALECVVHGFSKFFVEAKIVEDGMTSPLGVCINGIIFFIVYGGVYVLFRKTYKRGIRLAVGQGKGLTLFLCAVIFLLIYLRFELLLLRSMAFDKTYAWGIDFMLFVIPLLFLWSMMREVWVKKLNSDLDVLKFILSEKERQYAISRENIRIINHKSHDLKRMVHAFRVASGEDKSASLQEIEEAVDKYDSMANTGNKVIDVVVSENGLYCKEHGIDLTYTIDGGSLSFMRDTDVYVMFDNLFANAIEAVQRLTDETKRHISITVKQNRCFVVIQSRNYFAGALVMEQGVPETTKKNRERHGFGLPSIRYTVEKYGGKMTINSENEVFVVTLMLPIGARAR